jgi:hypothetical protein
MALFILVHSPSVGPRTWSAVAAYLRDAGHPVVVPSLLGVGTGGPPFWPRVAAEVSAQVEAARDQSSGANIQHGGTTEPEQIVLVAHSNAGVFVPVIHRALVRPVACTVLVDATMPALRDATPMVPQEFLPLLRGLAGPDGLLPRWTDWWDEPDVAAMFPDPTVRADVTVEQPQLPLAYYEEQVPVPPGWDDRPCGYLEFGEPYDAEAREAQRRGWTVRSLPGQHLHQLVDPGGVARILLDIAGLPQSSAVDNGAGQA